MKTKLHRIIYWVATIWLSLGMLSTGIVQIIQMKEEVKMIAKLGYPTYVLSMLGVWKILGVIAILVPRFPLVKEWAYAGFFFTISGAIFSHLAVGDSIVDCLGPALLLILTFLSWFYRPSNRKI